MSPGVWRSLYSWAGDRVPRLKLSFDRQLEAQSPGVGASWSTEASVIWGGGILRRPQAAWRGRGSRVTQPISPAAASLTRNAGAPAGLSHRSQSVWASPVPVGLSSRQALNQWARLSPATVGTQPGPRPVLQPSSRIPRRVCLLGSQAVGSERPSLRAPEPGHLAWLVSAQRGRSLGNGVGQTGLGLKSDSLGLKAWPQFPHLKNGS